MAYVWCVSSPSGQSTWRRSGGGRPCAAVCWPATLLSTECRRLLKTSRVQPPLPLVGVRGFCCLFPFLPSVPRVRMLRPCLFVFYTHRIAAAPFVRLVHRCFVRCAKFRGLRVLTCTSRRTVDPSGHELSIMHRLARWSKRTNCKMHGTVWLAVWHIGTCSLLFALTKSTCMYGWLGLAWLIIYIHL